MTAGECSRCDWKGELVGRREENGAPLCPWCDRVVRPALTAPKPFTAKELDELEPDHALLTLAEKRRLIAQAREEIRLRETNRLAAEALADDRDLTALELLRGNDDPAARAKRKLGEWLAEGDCRFWSDGGMVECEDQAERYMILLFRGRCYPPHEGLGANKVEAITAALRAAKGER